LGAAPIPMIDLVRQSTGRLRRLADTLFAYALIGALIALAAHLMQPAPAIVSGRPVVIDGDTIILEGEHMRLIGIDAPELAQACDEDGRTIACGRRARRALETIAQAPFDCRGGGHDIYGRRLVSCSAAGRDVASRLVADGQAVAEGCCRAEEAEARAQRRGIWAGSFERPADWRREHPRPD
jgi:endonuclease YncB( thermonuclease family)